MTFYEGCVTDRFGRALARYSSAQRFDPPYLHNKAPILLGIGAFLFCWVSRISHFCPSHRRKSVKMAYIQEKGRRLFPSHSRLAWVGTIMASRFSSVRLGTRKSCRLSGRIKYGKPASKNRKNRLPQAPPAYVAAGWGKYGLLFFTFRTARAMGIAVSR